MHRYPKFKKVKSRLLSQTNAVVLYMIDEFA